jgi:hypothetical protein
MFRVAIPRGPTGHFPSLYCCVESKWEVLESVRLRAKLRASEAEKESARWLDEIFIFAEKRSAGS